MLRDKVLVTGAEDPLPCGFSSVTKMRSPGAKVGATWTNLLAPMRAQVFRTARRARTADHEVQHTAIVIHRIRPSWTSQKFQDRQEITLPGSDVTSLSPGCG